VNPLQPQGRGNDDSQLLTGEEMFASMVQVLDHMDRTKIQVEEMETLLVVDRFVHGRDPKHRLSCWEFNCQAGRTYCAVDHTGTIHACGSDTRNHWLGQLDCDIDDEHLQAALARLHDKGDWVIRCFDCSASRICHHSCPTSDFNSDLFKEYDCRYTKLLYAHLCANPAKAYRIDAVRRAKHGPPPGSTFVPASQVRVVRMS
jgi:radical SAM protein with 4Fe4S-binding SPASM domain